MREEVVETLARRVKQAIAAAEEAKAKSETLVAARRVVRDPAMMLRRCAWCGRISLGRWTVVEEAPPFLPREMHGRTTHGICPDCLCRLERRGETKPVSG
jgi:hypothetical protein